MFCPKCGQQNPETGKFCRSCGTDLGNVTSALAAPRTQQLVNSKGRPINWEGAITKLFSGLAFLVVSIALAFTIGKGWWFWMLIPAFMSLGSGVAQIIQLKKAEKNMPVYSPFVAADSLPPAQNPSLPPPQTQFVSSESQYKTGDLVPPSVTDNTTRHLEMDSESKTMALPNK